MRRAASLVMTAADANKLAAEFQDAPTRSATAALSDRELQTLVMIAKRYRTTVVAIQRRNKLSGKSRNLFIIPFQKQSSMPTRLTTPTSAAS